MHRRLIVLWILIAGVVSACSLQFNGYTVNVTRNTPAAPVPPPVTPTFTPSPTFTPPPTAQLPACQPRADWVFYQVQPGDTLASIARRVNLDLASMANANCITNVNLIQVGQMLRVPFIPAPPTPAVSTPTGPDGTFVVFQPFLSSTETEVILPANQVVTVSWQRDMRDIHHVEFELRDFTNNTISLLGVDYDMSDGAAIQWLTAPQLVGIVGARGYLADGTLYSYSMNTNIRINASNVQVPCPAGSPGIDMVSVAPVLGVDNGCTVLSGGGAVTVSLFNIQEGTQMVEFWFLSSTGNTDVIGVDNDLSNGASIVWTVPPVNNLTGELYAFIYPVQGTMTQTGTLPVRIR